MAARLNANVRSAWSRPQKSEEDRSVVFYRDLVQGRIAVKSDGLATDVSFPKLPRAQKVSKDPGERAVLIQTVEHYGHLRSQFPELAEEFNGTSNRFGENIIVDGIDADSVCVGDVFQSDHSPLLLQVTFPRLACMRPDKRNPVAGGKQSGEPGTVRHWVSATGRGGLFCKVLTPGDIGEGDVLQLTQRSQPQWNLGLLSKLCYATTPMNMTWAGTRDELTELCGMKELGTYEWRERLQVILDEICVAEARSGDGTVESVGIKLDGTFQCRDCNQKFMNERALALHWKFIHDPNRHQED